MTNYVGDNTDLDDDKVDRRAIPPGESISKFITAANWNARGQALDDVRSSIRGAMFNVRDYGAIGDGATDDTTAIQRAIDAVTSAGGVVHFPPGVYSTGKLALKDNVTLQGHGAISYRLDVNLGASILKLNNDTDAELIDCDNSAGVELNGLVLRGRPSTGAAVGIRLTGGTTTTIRNCRITRFKSHGIYSEDNGIHRILDCIISYNGEAGVSFGFGVTDSMIHGCFINANTSHGVSLGAGSNMNFLIGNRIEWNIGRGVSAFETLQIQFVGNQLDRNQMCGMRVTGTSSGWSIVGNRFKRNAPAETTAAEKANLYIESLSNSVISGNVFHKGFDDDGGGTQSPDLGISHYTCTDVKIIGNILKGSTTTGTTSAEINNVGSSTNVTQIENVLTNALATYHRTAVPSGGTFEQGDKVWNSAPTIGSALLWRCVAGGTPGTWEQVDIPLRGSASWTPNIADGAVGSTTVTVTGAAVGDVPATGFTQAIPAGVVISGAVTAANTVTVSALNKSGSTWNPSAGTLAVRVWRQ